MTSLAMEANPLLTRVERSTVVVIDPRILFRESFIYQIQEHSSALSVLGFCSIASWQGFARDGADAAVIVIAAAHRSVPQMDAEFEALAAISPGVPVVLLSELEDYHQVAEAMQRGLRGFIPMTSPVKVAQSALALVLAGGCFIPSGIVCGRAAGPSQEGGDRGAVRLTEREAAVLGALQIGKPNKVIAYELNMCTNTVKVHVRNIMKKLQARNRTELAYLVNTKGLGSWAPRAGGGWFYGLPPLDSGTSLLPMTASTTV